MTWTIARKELPKDGVRVIAIESFYGCEGEAECVAGSWKFYGEAAWVNDLCCSRAPVKVDCWKPLDK